MTQTQNSRAAASRPNRDLDAVSTWCAAALQGGLEGPAGDPCGWATAAATAMGVSASGMRVAIVVESVEEAYAARGVSFDDDDFVAHQWTRSLLLSEAAPRRAGTLGLTGLRAASAGVRTPDAESDGVLTIEIGSRRPDWEAPEPVAEGLSIAAPMLAKVYERLVVTPVARQQKLLARLRPTQQALIPHLVDGLSEVEIAGKIGRSKHTVHDHTKKIYKVLGVSSRLELAAKWNGTERSAADRRSKQAARDSRVAM